MTQKVPIPHEPGYRQLRVHCRNSAFIMAYVVEGSIRSQVDGGPITVYQAGQTWLENPGAHHMVSENASATEPAKLLAVIVADSTETADTITVFEDAPPQGR